MRILFLAILLLPREQRRFSAGSVANKRVDSNQIPLFGKSSLLASVMIFGIHSVKPSMYLAGHPKR